MRRIAGVEEFHLQPRGGRPFVYAVSLAQNPEGVLGTKRRTWC